MKQYVIDQLRESDYLQILDHFKKNAEAAVFEDIFRVDLPEDLYSETQKEHAPCQPFYFAVHVAPSHVDFELLVRSRQILRCGCISYADRRQREYIIDYADGILRELNIKI